MKLLLYCTKGKPYLLREDIDKDLVFFGTNKTDVVGNILNGKIVGECDFEVSEIKRKNTIGDWYCYESQEDIWEQAKLGVNDFFKYLEGKNGYAIHIKNLHIFDEPKELSDYYSIHNYGGMLLTDKLTKAPQNMQRVSIQEWEYGTYNANDICVLLSIQPQWLCKILNGEKTIVIRKKVLRGML